MTRKIRAIGAVLLVALWLSVTAFAWFRQPDTTSVSERRPLAQFPALTADTLSGGKFMTEFEDYTLDQFPGRDAFRKLKSLVHYNVLQQKDNNNIYIVDGYAAKLDYPVNTSALDHALSRLNFVYETYLKEHGSRVFMSVVPDKSYYLAEPNGYPAMDYDTLFAAVQEKLPFAQHIDITDCLSIKDYYFTDTHWRQEALLPAAEKICSAMGVAGPGIYTPTATDQPFYGVYYGQAALPMDPDRIYLLENDTIRGCKLFDFETGKYSDLYTMEKLSGKDPYEVYLSGAKSLLRIENPNGPGDGRELIIFRDSFGSSIAPLLINGYDIVTLVDIRYMDSRMLGRFLDFKGQDVLFLYSTLVLNSGTTLK